MRPGKVTVLKVKGHATEEDVKAGRATASGRGFHELADEQAGLAVITAQLPPGVSGPIEDLATKGFLVQKRLVGIAEVLF